jgi:hypothetical protein
MKDLTPMRYETHTLILILRGAADYADRHDGHVGLTAQDLRRCADRLEELTPAQRKAP